MTPFEYRRATTVAEAVTWLRDEPEAKLLAGGQSLLGAMKLGLAAPPLLIDLGGIEALRALRDEGSSLWIGALCTHATVVASPLVRECLPGLACLAAGIADQQVRNRGTLGGSLANADPAACWQAGVLACGATLLTDRRAISADDFFQGLFSTALEPDELLLGAHFPLGVQLSYLKFEQPASRFALAGAAVARSESEVRVALTGLGHGVFRWQEAEAALSRRFEPEMLAGLRPDANRASSDLHASADYRLHLAGVLTRRALINMRQTS
ncbi:FAD binding domain-containing protein [Hydrogenophaga atypica]|jgi:carbon-monoxide dehydrogenase medium subunit|uniref:FAD binding domain-containing protein n=1 Tax=Hydrogenophaga atypica TaxID=249409 RepID=A0ABW2QSD7_9BURK